MMAWETHLTKSATHGTIVPLSNLEPRLCRKTIGSTDTELQMEVNSKVEEYNLQAENLIWYHDVKKELVRRGLISSSLLA